MTMPEPLFNSRARAWNRNLAFLALLTVGAAPYAAAFLALSLFPDLERGSLGLAMAAVALLLSGFLPWALQGRLALLGNRRLRAALHRRLGSAAAAEFVGFSPGGDLLSWEGETDQDVGFLDWEGNTLVYRGDRHAWTLRREGIDEIGVSALWGPGGAPLRAPGAPVRVAVYWHGPRDPGRALTLASREGDTVAATNRATLALARRLREWWEQEHPEPDETPLLGLPPTDLRGAARLDRPAPGSCLSALALAVIAGCLLWEVASRLTGTQQFTRGILWAGLIVTAAIIATGYVLAYLQVTQARKERQ
jgi:hypothetical protein